MVYSLTEKEFDYQAGLFKELGINKNEAIKYKGPELLKKIHKAYKKLALERHPDKGGSNKAMHALIRNHKELSNYIDPLIKNIGALISIKEFARILQAVRSNKVCCRCCKNRLRRSYSIFFYRNGILLLSLLLISSIYLAIKLFKAGNFITGPGILFNATLIFGILVFLLATYLTCYASRYLLCISINEDLLAETSQQKTDIQKYQSIISIFVYLTYVPHVLLIAGLVLQKCQDGFINTEVLIPYALSLSCIALIFLITEIYESKVVELVNTNSSKNLDSIEMHAVDYRKERYLEM